MFLVTLQTIYAEAKSYLKIPMCYDAPRFDRLHDDAGKKAKIRHKELIARIYTAFFAFGTGLVLAGFNF